MIYIDPKTLEVKGEIRWLTTEAHPKIKLVGCIYWFLMVKFKICEQIDSTTFEITDCRKKVFRFIAKDDISAQDWIAAIEGVL